MYKHIKYLYSVSFLDVSDQELLLGHLRGRHGVRAGRAAADGGEARVRAAAPLPHAARQVDIIILSLMLITMTMAMQCCQPRQRHGHRPLRAVVPGLQPPPLPLLARQTRPQEPGLHTGTVNWTNTFSQVYQIFFLCNFIKYFFFATLSNIFRNLISRNVIKYFFETSFIYFF